MTPSPVCLDADELQPELRARSSARRIGDRLAEHDVAGLREQAEDADHRAMRARRRRKGVPARERARRPSQPMLRRGLRRAAKTLIAQQQFQSPATLAKPSRIRASSSGSSGSGGMFIEKSARDRPGRLAAHHRRAPNECAAADDGFDQPPLSRLDIAARDGREVERQASASSRCGGRRSPGASRPAAIRPISLPRSRDIGALPAMRGRASRTSSPLPRRRIDWRCCEAGVEFHGRRIAL